MACNNLWTLRSLAVVAVLTTTASDAAAAIPDRVWGTYYGGGLPDTGLAVAVDAAGDVYVVGQTYSDEGIATPGAHKTIRQAIDAYIIKFDPAGSRIWGTYFGGTGSDEIFAITAVDGGIIIVGRTNSPEGISTPGSHQPVAGGVFDGYIARFTSDGVQEWGTYLGSNWDDYASTLAIVDDASIYVGGVARGPLPGLGTPGTHQPTITASGKDDGFLARFTPTGEAVWGTFYGGSRDDLLESITPAPDGGAYIAGETRSPDKIASPGAHDEAISKDDDIDEVSDSFDGFLARFADDGTRVWGTYYGGLGDDGFSGVVALPDGGAIAVGLTRSKDTIATPGAFQPAQGSADSFVSDGMIVRFAADGTRTWGTYFGGESDDQIEEIHRTPSGALFLLGLTYSQTGISTPDTFAPDRPGSADTFLARFTDAGTRTWTTYFGGEEIELPGGIAVAGDRIYLHGTTKSPTGIATPGAHLEQQTAPFNSDGFLVRFTQGGGAPCDGPDSCPDGLCVDDVCCDSPCGGGIDDCQVCSAALGATADGECTLLPATVVCRPPSDMCDAPELCPGDAGTCPDDLDLPDGDVCDGGVCMAGSCQPAPASTSTSDAGTTSADSDPDPGTTQPVPEDTLDIPTKTAPPGDPGTSTSATSTGGPEGDGDGGCACRQTGDDGQAASFGLLLLLAAGRRRPRPAASTMT